MKPDYKNWVPKGMLYSAWAGTAVSGVIFALSTAGIGFKNRSLKMKRIVQIASGICLAGFSVFSAITTLWYRAFDYNGKRQMSKQIIDGIADRVTIPDGGIGLDVGCGSGALAIACAKRNPNAKVVGLDRWGKEYANFSKELCESNAEAEGVSNVSFVQGDAVHLSYPDETFDAVTSNYVYHNITGVNKQELLLETLRVLKKGGTFAIHDVMSKSRYGDMDAFIQQLKDAGYEEVRLVDTTDGLFMSRKEAAILSLSGSSILLGRK